MKEQLEDTEIPKDYFAHKPELELCWHGLLISVSAGMMTRAQAEEMLKQWDSEDYE